MSSAPYGQAASDRRRGGGLVFRPIAEAAAAREHAEHRRGAAHAVSVAGRAASVIRLASLSAPHRGLAPFGASPAQPCRSLRSHGRRFIHAHHAWRDEVPGRRRRPRRLISWCCCELPRVPDNETSAACFIHRAERADGLVEALRALLVEPLPDAFAPEIIAVPTRGMERWLSQRMSARLGARPGRSDGVCANVEFPSPRRLLGGVVAVAAGLPPDEDPWLPERALWPLLEVM